MKIKERIQQYFRDHPWPDPSQLVYDPVTRNRGYIVGTYIGDGACGFMEICRDGDITGEFILVEPRHCVVIKDDQ